MPVIGSRHLYAGCHGSSNQVSFPFVPEQGQDSGFDIIYSAFDASSMVHFRSSLYYIPDIFNDAFSFIASHQISLTWRHKGGLKPTPERRLRGAYPHHLNSIKALLCFVRDTLASADFFSPIGLKTSYVKFIIFPSILLHLLPQITDDFWASVSIAT